MAAPPPNLIKIHSIKLVRVAKRLRRDLPQPSVRDNNHKKMHLLRQHDPIGLKLDSRQKHDLHANSAQLRQADNEAQHAERFAVRESVASGQRDNDIERGAVGGRALPVHLYAVRERGGGGRRGGV